MILAVAFSGFVVLILWKQKDWVVNRSAAWKILKRNGRKTPRTLRIIRVLKFNYLNCKFE